MLTMLTEQKSPFKLKLTQSEPQPDSDQALLQACRRGEARAWERLVDKYERLVFSIALKYGLSHDQAADITQLTFTIFLQEIDRLRDDSNLAAWLATVARRHTWRHLQHQRRESPDQASDLSDSPTLLGQPAADSIQQWERLEWLYQGLNQLDKPCRELITLLYFDPAQPSYEAVAAQTGRSVGSIGPIRGRCLKRLKEILNETGGQNG
ncbi:MAG TPA: sigma-70 family RNA polymerase sigma factor [Anaerolineae bacterium]|nr:sigma-70 family RNA polymerase sigma factor [Anaerolineae bacterium]